MPPILRPSFLCLLVVAVAAIAGCADSAPKRTLVGTWQAEFKAGKDAAEIVQTFREDGTFTFQTSFSNPSGGRPITITARGDYRLEGDDRLLTTPKDYAYAGVSQKSEAALKRDIESGKGLTATDRIQWIDDDTVEMVTDGVTTRFKRTKR